MSYNVVATEYLLRSVKKIFKKHRTILADIEKLDELLAKNPNYGTPLGNNLFKNTFSYQ